MSSLTTLETSIKKRSELYFYDIESHLNHEVESLLRLHLGWGISKEDLDSVMSPLNILIKNKKNELMEREANRIIESVLKKATEDGK